MSKTTDAVALFLKQRKYSPRTAQSYVFWATRLESHFPDRDIGKLKPADVASFFLHQQSRRLNDQSIRQAGSALGFLFREILRRTDLAEAIPRIKPSRPQALVPTQAEVLAIIAAVEPEQPRVAVKCIYGMGLELQEARSLRVRDVDFSINRIQVQPQRTKVVRSIPIPLFALEDLRKLCANAPGERHLFYAKTGGQIHEQTIQRAWAKARKKIGVKPVYELRSLRHAYIRHLELLGIRLVDVLDHIGIRKGRALEYYAAYSAPSGQIDFSPADRPLYDIDSTAVQDKSSYVAEARLTQLASIHSPQYDFTRLLALLQELNAASRGNNLLSVAFLVRAVIDHVPPLFGFHTFAEVVNNYAGTKSFKKSMEHLNTSLRNIADGYLHVPIRSKEDLPHPPQVDFRAPIDQLLGEVHRVLKKRKAI